MGTGGRGDGLKNPPGRREGTPEGPHVGADPSLRTTRGTEASTWFFSACVWHLFPIILTIIEKGPFGATCSSDEQGGRNSGRKWGRAHGTWAEEL